MLKCYVLTFEITQGSCVMKNDMVLWAKDAHDAIKMGVKHHDGNLVALRLHK